MAKLQWAGGARLDGNRSDLRHPTDLTNQEWTIVEGLIPPAKRGGNKRTVDVRRVVDGLIYALTTGCRWTELPGDLPPRTTLNEYFRRWEYDGTLARIHLALFGGPAAAPQPGPANVRLAVPQAQPPKPWVTERVSQAGIQALPLGMGNVLSTNVAAW
jgi:hypothetical protein